MIGIVDVEVQAANPQMPLCPFVAFVGSPSSVRVRNVPGNIGSWNITKVYVSANYPDNNIQSRECTRVGEIYVGTLPACDTAGKGANGFVVSADGVDENGNAVTGYVLGKGGLEILDADGAITPGVTTHYVHGLDEQPSDPHEYDIYKDGDTWKIYFNGAWGPLAPAPATLDDAVTRTSANGVKSSGIWSALWGALASLPTGFSSLYDWCVAQLAGKASTADATLTERGFSEWICSPSNYDNAPIVVVENTDSGGTEFYPTANNSRIGDTKYVTVGTETITWNAGEWSGDGALTATRTALQGYQLGSQTDKPLASEAEAVALRTGKANDNAVVKLTGDQTIGGNKTFLGEVNIDSFGGVLVISNSQDNGRAEFWCVYQSEETGCALEIWMYDGLGNNYWIKVPQKNGVLALLQNIAPNYSPQTTYAVNQLCVSNDVLKRCTTAGTGNAAVFTNATIEDVLAALRAAIAGKENASNKVTSLTAQSTDTQYPSAKCVYDALQGANTKVKELFNADENVKCDGEGQVFKPDQTGNYWTWGSSTYNFTEKVTSGGNTFYVYGTGLSALSYNPATGLLTNAYGQAKCQCGVGLNPLAGDDISPTDGNTDLTFTKLASTWPTNPTDLFARVSDLAAFSTTKNYAVGDIAGYNGKVYKCTTAHTGAWNASHFTLATKAEAQAYLAGLADKASKSVQKPATALTSATKCKVTYDENGLVTAGADLSASDIPALPYMAEDAKIQRIYNESGTDALDDKGQMFKSSLQGNYWTVGAQQYNYVGPSGNEYTWQISSAEKITYNKNTGVICEKRKLGGVNYSYDRGTVTTGLNPANGDIIPSLPGVQFYYGNGATFTPLAPTMDTSPYAHFAIESLPDRTWAVGVWAVGDLVKYSDKAYRCKAATTSSDTTAPSSDTTHWTEIPVLSQKQDALSQTQLDNIAAVPNKANASDLRYTLPGEATAISSASSEVVSGETVYYGAATLADRTQNQVLVLVALDELRVTIPPAVSGKVRDFGLLVGVGLGEGTALAAPALVPVAPTGETITMMNAEGEMPTLADGTTTASGLTVLYFTEIGTGAFLVKGEQIRGVA